ncbi:MAG TPA: carbohydrate ABC transporter permease [Clostridia bacterium]
MVKTSFKKIVKRYLGVNWRDYVFHICNYLFFVVIAIIMAYPFYYVFSKSLIVIDVRFGAPREIFGLGAYKRILTDSGLPRAFLLTVFVAAVHIVVHIFVTMISAYPLSRKYLKGRNFFLVFLLITMLFSGGLIPFYILIRDLGLRDNILVYLIPGMFSAYDIIICKNFLQSIPDSLEEAARIDGANDLVILFKIFYPLSLPIIATIALWAGVYKWNNWMTGVLYIKDKNLWLIQNFLRNILITTTSSGGAVVDPEIMNMTESVKMAAIVISIIPILIVYPFVQKYFIKGIILGSVKG